MLPFISFRSQIVIQTAKWCLEQFKDYSIFAIGQHTSLKGMAHQAFD